MNEIETYKVAGSKMVGLMGDNPRRVLLALKELIQATPAQVLAWVREKNPSLSIEAGNIANTLRRMKKAGALYSPTVGGKKNVMGRSSFYAISPEAVRGGLDDAMELYSPIKCLGCERIHDIVKMFWAAPKSAQFSPVEIGQYLRTGNPNYSCETYPLQVDVRRLWKAKVLLKQERKGLMVFYTLNRELLERISKISFLNLSKVKQNGNSQL